MELNKPIYLTQHVTAHGAMDRDYEGIGHLALFRESRSRRVIVARVEKNCGPKEEVQYTWLERQSLQAYTQGSVSRSYDLYLDEFGDKVQA